MKPFEIKEGDTLRKLRIRLVDETDTAVDVESNDIDSFKFIMTRDGDTTPTIASGSLTVVQSGATDAGVVEYAWQSGDTDTAGRYWAEVEVTYTDSAVQTFPADDYIPIVIKPDLG